MKPRNIEISHSNLPGWSNVETRGVTFHGTERGRNIPVYGRLNYWPSCYQKGSGMAYFGCLMKTFVGKWGLFIGFRGRDERHHVAVSGISIRWTFVDIDRIGVS